MRPVWGRQRHGVTRDSGCGGALLRYISASDRFRIVIRIELVQHRFDCCATLWAVVYGHCIRRDVLFHQM
jgi:hypothetical protein